MEIYLMRHAEAISHGHWERDDASRPLSESGKSHLQEALPWIGKALFSPDVVLTSPYVRAKDTAEMVCSVLQGKKPVLSSLLVSGASISAFKSAVNANKEKSSLLIVGHMPDLAHFASAMTLDPWLLDDAHMDPGAIWALDPGNFEKHWGDGKFLWKRNLADWKTL